MANQELIAALQEQVEAIMLESAAPRACEHEPAGAGDNSTSASAALKKIVSLVNVSDRSELAIRDRLSRNGFNAASIDEAVSQAKSYGFINDARFADVLIRSRISQGRGSSGIERELLENGIDASSVEGWPFEYPLSFDEEFSRALDLLERKPPRSKNVREAAYRRLVQKGYPSSVASSAARTYTQSLFC